MSERAVALVTGASRGIGRAVALCLARDGFDLVLNYRTDQAAAESVAAGVERAGATALIVRADVADAGAVKQMFAILDERFGHIDALVCNAGQIRDTLLGISEPADFDHLWAVNVQGAVSCAREASRRMMRRRRGSIVTISSVAAQRPGRGQSNYAATKGALESFTRALAVELAPRKIRVNAVAPGVIATDMTADLREIAADEIARRVLLRRPGAAEEVAEVVAFLCSERASYVTGQVWNVDGGFKLE